MFSFQLPTDHSSRDSDATLENKTIRFVDRHTVIADRRRKTIRPPRFVKLNDNEDDPELAEILSMGSATEYDPEMCQLSQPVAMAMGSILDDAAESSCIMGKTFGLPDIDIDMAKKSLVERNEQLRSHSTLFNPETLEDYSKTGNAYMIRKLHADIVFLQNILSKGVKSLLMNYNFHPWLMYIDYYDMQLEQDAKLLEMIERKTERLQQLKDRLQNDKIQSQIDLDELSLSIGKARDEVEDFIIQAEIKETYVSDWEKSRRQQNFRLKTGKEKMYEDRIAKAHSDIRRENRVHSEITAYMTEFFKDLENSILEWMNTYDKDIETKEDEILKMGFDIENLANDLTKLQNEYDKRTEEMNDWLAHKAEKKRIEEEIRFLNNMATKIQAWWRGTMVRNKLGPYRPKKKEKKKPKK